VKQDQAMNNSGRKAQGVPSAAPTAPPSQRESGNRKREEKKKTKPGNLAHSAGRGK